MPERNYMEKAGLVTQVNDSIVKVLLLDTSGCASCSNSLCMLADAKSRYVDVPLKGRFLRSGDEVLVRVKPSSAYRATFWLYGMPFLLIMVTLFGMTAFGIQESLAGLSGLLVLAPYYAGLFLFRRHTASTCAIDIVKR
jgi:positive regulator of sigma E activity